MLIDASHPEETRVVVLRGSKVEEFDFESASRKQLRGNIYLAKVTRVEPSLQAAFVEYGGNRHGFLAFSEIHPDYYQIPVADRQALIEAEAQAERDYERDEERRRSRRRRGGQQKRAETAETVSGDVEASAIDNASDSEGTIAEPEGAGETGFDIAGVETASGETEHEAFAEEPSTDGTFAEENAPENHGEEASTSETVEVAPKPQEGEGVEAEAFSDEDDEDEEEDEDEEDQVEQLGGGDAMDDVPERPRQHRRQYKIQEVIKRRQILLVQVVKEERGNKGAALTTYLSLAGRYSVLMPNTGRGGGISRKITNAADRKRLKEIAQELEVPEGMGIILRTAGAARTKQEIRRDYEYLMRMWESVRELTLKSSAPALVYEEGSLIKRAIRDLYNKDIDEVVVSGEDGYREAKDFMRMLMPSHAKTVRPYREPVPLFARTGIEAQLDAMFSNHVTLRSGGYLVINPTEALVSIDVNSGRSTREHNIEDTALRTNLEAAEEIARQLRLRDLAGLIVIDFIDMEEKRNNRAVEKKLNESLKNDRARIQVGRISPFGLLEMSRQRIRTGVLESSSVVCPHCVGTGFVRSTSSVALQILRAIEDTLIRGAGFNLHVRTRTEVAFYMLNQKRVHLRDLEDRFGVMIAFAADDTLSGSANYVIDRGEPATRVEHRAPATGVQIDSFALIDAADAEADEAAEAQEVEDAEADEPGEVQTDGERRSSEEGGDRNGRRRRRRRRRGRDRDGQREGEPNGTAEDGSLLEFVASGEEDDTDDGDEGDDAIEAGAKAEGDESEREAGAGNGEDRGERRRRRGRRGGRGREREPRGERHGNAPASFANGEEAQPEGSVAAVPTTEAEVRPVGDEEAPDYRPVAEEPDGSAVAMASGRPIDETAQETSDEFPPQPAPEPEPVAVILTPPDPSRPKRAGWWSKAKQVLSGS
jgi:ribonuclease E